MSHVDNNVCAAPGIDHTPCSAVDQHTPGHYPPLQPTYLEQLWVKAWIKETFNISKDLSPIKMFETNCAGYIGIFLQEHERKSPMTKPKLT